MRNYFFFRSKIARFMLQNLVMALCVEIIIFNQYEQLRLFTDRKRINHEKITETNLQIILLIISVSSLFG